MKSTLTAIVAATVLASACNVKKDSAGARGNGSQIAAVTVKTKGRAVLKSPSAYNEAQGTVATLSSLQAKQQGNSGQAFCVLPEGTVITMSSRIQGPYFANHYRLDKIIKIELPASVSSGTEGDERHPIDPIEPVGEPTNSTGLPPQGGTDDGGAMDRIRQDVERIAEKNRQKAEGDTAPMALNSEAPSEVCPLTSGYIFKDQLDAKDAVVEGGQLRTRYRSLPETTRLQNNPSTCGHASVAVTASLLNRKNYTDNNFLSYLALRDAINSVASIRFGDPEFSRSRWLDIERSVNVENIPVIIGLGHPFKYNPDGPGHIYTILAIEGDNVVLGDPAKGRERITTKAAIEAAQPHKDGKFLIMRQR